MFEHSICARDRDIAGFFLLVCVCDFPVVDDKGVAAGSLANGPADGLGEFGRGVGHE